MAIRLCPAQTIDQLGRDSLGLRDGLVSRRRRFGPRRMATKPYSGASTRTHPTRSSGSASACDISTVPSSSMLRWAPRQQLNAADAGGGFEAHAALARLRPLPQLLGEHAVIRPDAARLAPGLLEPVQHLRGRVDLMVVFAVGKGGQFVDVFGEPARLLGQVDKVSGSPRAGPARSAPGSVGCRHQYAVSKILRL